MKFDWKVGNKYVNRAGQVVTMVRTEYGDSIVMADATGTTSSVWVCNGCQNKNPELHPWPVDIMSEFKEWTIGTTYVAKNPAYSSYKYQLVAINPEHTRPYVVRYGTKELDTVTAFSESDLKTRELVVAPRKVKVWMRFDARGKLIFADTHALLVGKDDILRMVEVEL